MALFRCAGGGSAPISVGTLVSSSTSYTATEDGLYVHVTMGCMGGGKWAGSISQSGGTVLYSYTIGSTANTYSDQYQNYCLGIRIVYLTKGETVSSKVGGGVTLGTTISKTIKLT